MSISICWLVETSNFDNTLIHLWNSKENAWDYSLQCLFWPLYSFPSCWLVVMNNHKSKTSTLCHTYIHPRIDKKTTSQKVLHLKISMHITDHKSRSWQNVFNMMVVKEGVITKHFKFKVMYVWSETIESKK
jgi:hypothetical protein